MYNCGLCFTTKGGYTKPKPPLMACGTELCAVQCSHSANCQRVEVGEVILQYNTFHLK